MPPPTRGIPHLSVMNQRSQHFTVYLCAAHPLSFLSTLLHRTRRFRFSGLCNAAQVTPFTLSQCLRRLLHSHYCDACAGYLIHALATPAPSPRSSFGAVLASHLTHAFATPVESASSWFPLRRRWLSDLCCRVIAHVAVSPLLHFNRAFFRLHRRSAHMNTLFTSPNAGPPSAQD